MWLIVWSGLAFAQDTCQEIRNVRALAVRDGLDERSLVQLERSYCGAQQPIPANGRPASADCDTLQMLAWLYPLGGGDAAAGQAVVRARDVACAMGVDEARRSWENGITMKSSSGAWSYPNGITARSSSGALSYPNGITARSASGTWTYPNGITARSASGRWSRPDGLSVASEQDLLSWACTGLGRDCQTWLAWVGANQGEARDAAVMSMAWTAKSR